MTKPLPIVQQMRFRVRKDQRGAVALLAALMLPVLIGMMGFGVDVSYWAAIRTELQRTADVAAMAGAAKYASTGSSSAALTTAANVAELNGIPVGTRAGDGTTILIDSSEEYSATVTFAAPASVKVAVQRAIPLMFTKLLLSKPTQTVAAVAVAQVMPRTVGNQACVLGLNGLSDGVTTSDDLTISGGKNTNILMSGCDLRSDASMQFNGNPRLGVPDIVASGTIGGTYDANCPSGQTPCDQEISSLPQTPDPFAIPYGSKLSISATAVPQPSGMNFGPPPSGTAYTSLNFGPGTYTLSSGVYYVAGSISFSGNGTVTGTGVTFIMSGSLQVSGSATLNLSAPSSGTMAGLLFGSNSSGSSVAFSGNSTQNLTGAIYLPHGSITITGNTSSALSCLTAVAQWVTFAGSSSLSNSRCANAGVPAVYDLPGIVHLVQ